MITSIHVWKRKQKSSYWNVIHCLNNIWVIQIKNLSAFEGIILRAQIENLYNGETETKIKVEPDVLCEPVGGLGLHLQPGILLHLAMQVMDKCSFTRLDKDGCSIQVW